MYKKLARLTRIFVELTGRRVLTCWLLPRSWYRRSLKSCCTVSVPSSALTTSIAPPK